MVEILMEIGVIQQEQLGMIFEFGIHLRNISLNSSKFKILFLFRYANSAPLHSDTTRNEPKFSHLGKLQGMLLEYADDLLESKENCYYFFPWYTLKFKIKLFSEDFAEAGL